VTRRDAASSFFGEENVPHQALTMGVGTILDARKVSCWLSANTGAHREAGRRSPVSDAVTASYLQQHPTPRSFSTTRRPAI